ncbi:MAG: 50S ribosomal protein L4 [Syntrophales bacterium]
MPIAGVYDIEKKLVSEITLDDAIFDGEINEHVLYEVVRMQLVSKRSGTAETKGRSDISGGGKKPWRQKGTGRARSGTSRSPLWRGGGTVFGPHPRDYSFKVPKKVRRKALQSALTLKYRGNQIVILKDFPLEEIKTKKFMEVLQRFGWEKVLFVLDKSYPVLEKASRNIKNVKMMRTEGVNVYDLLKHEHVVFLEPSLRIIEGTLNS